MDTEKSHEDFVPLVDTNDLWERRYYQKEIYNSIHNLHEKIIELHNRNIQLEEAIYGLVTVVETHIKDESKALKSVTEMAKAWRESKIAWKWFRWIMGIGIIVGPAIAWFIEESRKIIK